MKNVKWFLFSLFLVVLVIPSSVLAAPVAKADVSEYNLISDALITVTNNAGVELAFWGDINNNSVFNTSVLFESSPLYGEYVSSTTYTVNRDTWTVIQDTGVTEFAVSGINNQADTVCTYWIEDGIFFIDFTGLFNISGWNGTVVARMDVYSEPAVTEPEVPNTAATPEPGTILLLGLGLIFLVFLHRKSAMKIPV